MKKLNLTLIFSGLLLLFSCSTEPEKIEYGFDACTFCEMTIVDQSHAALMVSDKGKTYKFDAIECMLRYSNREEPQKEYAHVLVSDYLNPGAMMVAKDAFYLISKEIPSPMGGNLSALSSEKISRELKKQKNGEILRWDEVVGKFQ